ncbi:MAG: hypothetical protein P4M11_13775 [Candidatus Pacebacteria bacterium]|nr:hypothetical protein [Candidatus Paceibacterota bacterium]
MTQTGKYFCSRFRDSGSTAMRDTAKRFSQENESISLVPGPGKYEPLVAITKDGKQFYSRFSSSCSRGFSHAKKDSLTGSAAATPGPGSYVSPSDFGIYESRNAEGFLAEERRKWDTNQGAKTRKSVDLGKNTLDAKK